MSEALDKQLQDLAGATAVYKKGLADIEARQKDCITKAELDTTIKAMLEKFAPVEKPVAKHVLTTKGYDGKDTEVTKALFLQKVFGRFKGTEDGSFEREMAAQVQKTGQTTTVGQGGYLIPASWYPELVNIVNETSTLVPKFRNIPMVTPTLHANEIATDTTVYWSTEATDKTTSKATFTQDDLTLHTLYSLTYASNEVSVDSIPPIADVLFDMFVQNAALELEQEAMEGTTFTGLSTAGINTAAQIGVNFAHRDILNCINNATQLERYRAKSEWMLNRTAMSYVMGLVDTNNHPIWNATVDGVGKLVLAIEGYKVNIVSTIATAAGVTTIYFGPPNEIWMGRKNDELDFAVRFNTLGIISSSTSVSVNLFQSNQRAWLFEMRRALLVAVPAAFTAITSVVQP